MCLTCTAWVARCRRLHRKAEVTMESILAELFPDLEVVEQLGTCAYIWQLCHVKRFGLRQLQDSLG
jgi:hypothetical protein